MIDEFIKDIEQPKFIYAFKFKKLGVYSDLVVANEEPQRRISVIKRGLAMNPEAYESIKGTEYYCLGVYDDTKGQIISCNEYLLDIDQVYELTKDILGIKKEGDIDVSKESQ